MSLSIGTNIGAMVASRNLAATSDKLTKTYQRLSSGDRITQSGDDPAGLSISENLRSQIRSMGQASRNASDGISFVQVAEGGLTEISNSLIRLRELGIQAASDTVGDRERAIIHQEAVSIVNEVDRLSNVTEFNGTPLLNNQAPKGVLEFHVGIRNGEQDRIYFDPSTIDTRTDTLGIASLNYESIDSAKDTLEKVDGALSKVLTSRSSLGAMQTKLQAVVRNLDVTKENLAEARSRVADTNMAEETSALVHNNILQQVGVAVLAQANSSPSTVLRLL